MRFVMPSMLVVLIISFAAIALAADPEPQKPTDRPASPMITEIRAVLEASRLEVANLAAQGAAHPGHEADIAHQKQIAQLKQQAELDILAIQVRYARAEGKEDLAQQIEASIAAIISPPTPAAPTEVRPAPDTQR